MSLILDPGRGPERPELISVAEDAVELVPSGATLVVGGSGSLLQVPETLLGALETRWAREGAPSALTVIHVMGLGDHEGRGIDHIAISGLVERFISSHYVLSPREQQLIADERVEALALPAGTISLLFREVAAGRPGLFTDIGLGTFVDPRQGWGRMNARTRKGISELVELRGQEWLFYPSPKLDVAFLRASEADRAGNLSMDDEAAFSDNLAIAQAVHNCGGLVIAEVKRIVASGSIPAARVAVPGILVDSVVVTEWGGQTPITEFDPRRTGIIPNRPAAVAPLPLDHRKVVARRAAFELGEGDLANLGVGMANGISYVALEERFIDKLTFTIEQGLFGGLPGLGLDSGTAVNPSAIIDMTSIFDLYDGGALDFAGLAFAQVDRFGNVNVIKAEGKPIGPGGFIDISQKARTVVFCGSFRGGGLRTRIHAGELSIVQEGRYPKFVSEVDCIAFNAERARERGQRVLYVTERAVFGLGAHGLELLEIAPGIDLRRDLLDHMAFEPVIAGPIRQMDARLFLREAMGLKPARRRPRVKAPERRAP